MERHFVDTAKAFMYYPYLKKGEVHAPYIHGTVVRQVDGVFIAQLNYPALGRGLPLKA